MMSFSVIHTFSQCITILSIGNVIASLPYTDNVKYNHI